jgi:hypothetical protein
LELREYFEKHVAEWSRPTLDPKRFCSLKFLTPVTPIQYLAFAEKDLRSGGPRGLVNALTNAKRAIDCSVRNILGGIGIAEPRNFPDRLSVLNGMGLVAPRIIRKIVHLRNFLEHDYYLPKRAETEDAVDVAALFVATLKPLFSGGNYMESAWIADQSSINPRPEFVRTATHTTWRHNAGPKYTYARGIFLESPIGDKKIHLDLVHENAEVGSAFLIPRDRGYAELQGLLLRSVIDNFAFKQIGAKKFISAIRNASS